MRARNWISKIGREEMASRTRERELNKKKRITVQLSEEADNSIKEISKSLGISISEVIRRALGTEKFLQKAQSQGKRVLLENSDKNIKEVVLRGDFDSMHSFSEKKSGSSEQRPTKPAPSFGIVFEEEYFQAGVNILSYFSTYLRTNYPDENVKVAIEQEGLTVKLYVTDSDGNPRDELNRLLTDFLGGVTGDRNLEEITINRHALYDMKFQLQASAHQLNMKSQMIEDRDKLIGHLVKTHDADIDRRAIEFRELTDVIRASVENQPTLTISPAINQVVNSSFDNPLLLFELGEIKRHLERQRDNESKDVSVELAEAIESARKGDEGRLSKISKATAKFILDSSVKVVAPVATQYLKSKFGLD